MYHGGGGTVKIFVLAQHTGDNDNKQSINY